MDKLIIKNVGIIKYINIDLNRIIFLIGEDNNGKYAVGNIINSIINGQFDFNILDKNSFIQIKKDNQNNTHNNIIDFKQNEYIHRILYKLKLYYESNKEIDSYDQSNDKMKNFFDFLIKNRTSKSVLIENPEHYISPINQIKIVQLIITFIKNTKDNNIIIVTNSPYILTAFNNFIFVNELSKLKPNNIKTIESIIDREYWIDYNNISAYKIVNGQARNILDDKFKIIDAGRIDAASDIINNIYEKLSEIEYSDN